MDGNATVYDSLCVGFKNQSGTTILARWYLSNTNASSLDLSCGTWNNYYVALPSNLFGQTLRFYIKAYTDQLSPTIFRVDNFSLMATTVSSCTYSVSPSGYTCPSASAGTFNNVCAVTTQSGCTWSVAVSGCSWLTVTPSSGTGSGSFGISVTANTSSSPRSCTVYIQGNPFVVTQPAASTCNSPSGINSSGITTTSATLSWNAVSGASGYTVEYKATSSGTWITAVTNLASTSYNLTGLSPSTSYNWRVSTVCTNGATSSPTAATLSTLGCSAPTSLSTSNLGANTVTLNWVLVSGASSYDVEYKLNSASNWSNAATNVTTNSFNLTGLIASSTYDWRVRSNCGGGLYSAYTQAAFVTLVQCNSPTGLTPSNVTSTSATLSWTAVSGSTGYNIDYKPNSSGNWISLATNFTGTTLNTNSLQPFTAYDWRVNSICGSSSNASPYAQSSFFTQSGVGIDELSKYGVTVTPNPFVNYILVDYTGDYRVDIIDAYGRQVIGDAPSRMLNTEALKSGVYFLRLFDSSSRLLSSKKMFKIN